MCDSSSAMQHGFSILYSGRPISDIEVDEVLWDIETIQMTAHLNEFLSKRDTDEPLCRFTFRLGIDLALLLSTRT